jgi:predicted Zn-dependent protease
MNRTIIPVLLLLAGCAARQPGDPIKPGFNMFSQEQEVQLGREAAAEIRKQVHVVPDQGLQNWISGLGRKLASQPQAGQYPYSFTLIQEDSINAFALPGGPIFVHTGLVTAADNEAQLVGVLAHEIGHIALRHATNQASKAQLIQIPAVLGGAALGNNSMLGQLGQLGIGFGANSLLLKYSRDAERQSDNFGARLMHDAGYNPLEMARFFEKLEAEGGSRAPQFLSSHPNPENRVAAVQRELTAFPPREYDAASSQFGQMKRAIAALPARPKPAAQSAQRLDPPPQTGARLELLRTSAFQFAYPADWEIHGDQSSAVITLAPRGGLARNSQGSVSIGFGAVASYYQPRSPGVSLRGATAELFAALRSFDRRLRVDADPRPFTVMRSPGLLTPVTTVSPFGGAERQWLLTVERPQGLFYLVLIAPENSFASAQPVFEQMLRSLRFAR